MSSKTQLLIWCDFDRASSLICGNKLQTRCNRGFYCRSYCLLNMFRAPLCPSSGAQEYYTVVAACGISCCGFQVAGLVWSWGLCVRFAGCCSIPQTRRLKTPLQQPSPYSQFSLKLCSDRLSGTLIESDSTICCMYTTVSSWRWALEARNM